MARYRGEIAVIDGELRRERTKLQVEFSREHRKETEKRIADLKHELAVATGALRGKRDAEKRDALEARKEIFGQIEDQKKVLASFDAQIRKVHDLTRARDEAINAAKRSQAATGLFREAGRATGEIPGINDIVAQGLGRISPALAEIVSKISMLGPAGQAGGSALAGLGSKALLTAGILGGLATAAAGAGTAIVSGALDTAKWADGLEDLSARTGISVKDLQKLEFIGRSTDLALDDLVTATRALSKAMVEGSPVFDDLKIKTKNADGSLRSIFSVLLDISAAFQRMPGDAERINAATELFGRSAQSLLPTLIKGPDALRRMGEEAERLSPNIEALAKAHDAYEFAAARAEAAGRKFSASTRGSVSAVTSLKNAWADFLVLMAQGFSDTQGGFGAGRGTPPPPGEAVESRPPALPRSLAPPGVPPGNIPESAKRESKDILEARKKIEDVRQQQARAALADAERLIEAQRELNKLKAEEAGLSDFQLKKNLEQQANLVREIGGLEAQAAERRRTEASRLTKELTEAQARDLDLLGDRQKAVADAARKTARAESETLNVTQQRLGVVDAELAASLERETAARKAADSEKLSAKERLEAQKKINNEVEKSTKLIREQGELSKVVADAFQKIASEALAGKPTRQAPPSMMQAPQPRGFRDFTSELADLRVQEALGVNVVNQELEVRRALNAALLEQIQFRLASGLATGKEREELEKLLGALKQNREEISRGSTAAFKQSTFGQFLEGMQKVSDIIGKFAPSLNKGLGQMFALFEVFKALGDQLRLLGGGTMQGGQVVGGSAFAGLQGIFTGRGPGTQMQFGTDAFGAPTVSGGQTTLTSGQRMQAAMMLIAGISGGISQWRQGGTLNRTIGGATTGGAIGMLGGPIGAAIGAIIGAAVGAISSTQNKGVGTLAGWALGGPIGAIFGFRAASRRAETKRIADQIKAELKTIVDAYGSGAGTLKATIDGLEKERAAAIARLTGKKGASKQLKEITDAIDKELLTLKRQQKDILEAFDLKVALAGVPENARETAQSISELAAVLKEAADAGASADQQIKYLNATLDDLKVKLGRDLRSDEQGTIDLLMQEINLQKQREGIIKDAAEAELAVKQKLGISRVLTPAQEAAQEIKKIRDQRDEKLKSLDEEAARLKAQVEGRAELFGFTSDELDLQGQRATLLERQLELERSITSEIIARIQEQKALFASLAAGTIPNLPAGILPPGYAFPQGTGAQYFSGDITIQIQWPAGSGGGRVSPGEAADIIRRGTRKLADDQDSGFSA